MRLLLAVLILCTSVTNANATTGTVSAIQSCEAYQSFRKKTNPGKVLISKGQYYTYKEVSITADHTKYRIVIKGAKPALRWIDGRCVKPLTQKSHKKHFNQVYKSNKGTYRCTTVPGLADSNVLALSWQSAFCETKRDKAECQVRDPKSFQANNFTLHGLWPNRDNCNRKTGYYGNCNSLKTKPKKFCGYPKLDLNDSTRAQLEIYMPSAAHGTCLQRHEWYRHGTCQTQLDVSQYYDFAIKLQQEFNNSGMAQLMTENIGKRVASANFFNSFDKAFGAGAHQKLQLRCKAGDLIDVYINLPKDLDQAASLKTLLGRAENDFKNGCGALFSVNAIND